jgi:hypothetical protein
VILILILVVSCSGPKHDPMAQYRPQVQQPQYQPAPQVAYQPQYDQQYQQPQYQPAPQPQVIIQKESSNGLVTGALAGAAGYVIGNHMAQQQTSTPVAAQPQRQYNYRPVAPTQVAIPATRVLPSSPVIAAKPVVPVTTPSIPNYRPAQAPISPVSTSTYKPAAVMAPVYRPPVPTTVYRSAPTTSSYRSYSPSPSRR